MYANQYQQSGSYSYSLCGRSADNGVCFEFSNKRCIRIFIGSTRYYGGGSNLVPGQKYYVNIQTYSEQYGWSELQSKEIVLPK